MRLPLVVLAVCSVFGGLVDLPFHPGFTFLQDWLQPVFGSRLLDHPWSAGSQWIFAIVDAALATAGAYLAWVLWRSVVNRPAVEPAFLQRAWYIDYWYDRLLARGSTLFAAFSSAVVENRVIDGAVNGAGRLVRATAGGARRIQTGYVRNYALGILAGMVAVLAFLFFARVTG
jgi:NADH-quinone oxidoreductase subunit L